MSGASNVAIAMAESGGLQKITVTSEQMQLAKQTVAKDLDDNQFALFCYNCQRLGVHPLDGLLVPIVRNDSERGEKRLTFVNTVDLLRSRAAETNDYAGSDDPKFEYNLKADPQLPSDAFVTVWKFVQGERCAFSATARWEEYYPGEKQGFMWRNKPHVMLGKCAEALALRKAFPKQLAGLYIPEELQKEIESSGKRTPPRQAGKQQQPQKPVGDVMCGFCGQKNSHAADCKYAVACMECHAPAGKPHATGCSLKGAAEALVVPPLGQSQPEPSQTASTLEKWLVQVEAIDSRERTEGAKKTPYLMVTCFNAANENVTLYCWHTGETRQRLLAVKPKTKCIFMVKQSKGERPYWNLEEIVEITGEKLPEGEIFPPK